MLNGQESLAKSIETVNSYVEDPTVGLPEEVFKFATTITPMINVDLLVKNEKGHVLMSWRDDMCAEDRTIVLYESPYRVVKTLEQLAEVMGPDRQVAVCREISKVHEQTVRGTLSEALAHFREHAPKGEFVIIIGQKN